LTVVKTIQKRTKPNFANTANMTEYYVFCLLIVLCLLAKYIYKALKLGNINLYGRTSTSVMSKIHAKQPH